MTTSPQVPAYIDTTKASIARIYDACIGGKDNYEVDRQAVEMIRTVLPEIEEFSIDHRQFLIRAARFIATQTGIRNYLDCGSGLPTAENTHQVVQRIDPESRVVYVDNDPSVIAHGRALLEENELTRFVGADIWEVEKLLADPVVAEHLDWTEPIGLFHVGTLHHYNGTDPTPAEAMRTYIDALPSGSFVAVAHFFDPGDENTPLARRIEDVAQRSGLGSGWFRTRAEIEAMLPGLELVEPGLVPCADWWPDGPHLTPLSAAQRCIAGVVARKP